MTSVRGNLFWLLAAGLVLAPRLAAQPAPGAGPAAELRRQTDAARVEFARAGFDVTRLDQLGRDLAALGPAVDRAAEAVSARLRAERARLSPAPDATAGGEPGEQEAELRKRLAALDREAGELAELAWIVNGLQAELAARRQASLAAARLDELARKSTSPFLRIDELRHLLRQAARLKADSAGEQRRQEARTEELAHQAELLGTPTAGESSAVTQERRRLSAEQARAERALRDAGLNLLNAEQLVGQLDERVQAEAKAALLERDEGAATLVARSLTEREELLAFGRRLLVHGSGWPSLRRGEQVLAVALLLIALAAGLRLRAGLRRRAAGMPAETFGSGLAQSASTSVAVHLPWLVMLAVAAGQMALLAGRIGETPALTYPTTAMLLFLVIRTVARSVLAPYPPATSRTPLTFATEYRLSRRLMVLTLVAVAGYLLQCAGRGLAMPEAAYLLVRAVCVVAGCVNLLWLLWLVDGLPGGARYGGRVKGAAFALLTVTVVAELMGARNLSGFLLRGVVGTLAFIPLVWIAARLVDELVRGLANGSARWAEAPRRQLGCAAGQELPGAGWLRFLAAILLWSAVALVLCRLWSSPSGWEALAAKLKEGLPLGSLVLRPDRLYLALVLFSALIAVGHWARAWLDQVLIRRGRLDQGGRAAAVTLAGYAAFALAGLATFVTLGVDLTSLAVVFGALSVGIGFGLQNIVNNFVSGLILLFERPIKVGDWIRVGDAEGIVRNLTVRFTELQTFDRTELIIPNSDLISQRVTNITRRDVIGRVILTVGVAYGSDARRVQELLLETVTAHPNVAAEDDDAPLVTFSAFGESSLDFEVRCILRDVTQRLKTHSELNLAILDAFAANGIEIPFPQRDVHMK